jgi:hypothetical protein
MAMAATLLAGCGVAEAGANANANANATAARSHSRCTLPSGVPSIVLSDTTPTPTLTVHAGDQFIVLVQPWVSTHATVVSVGVPGIAVEQCTVLLHDGGRRSIFTALGAGTSWLSATVTPASGLFMPAWGGTVTVGR